MPFLRFGLMVMESMKEAGNNKPYHPTVQDYAFDHLTNDISIMIVAFEILLCFAPVIELHKRLKLDLELFYVGCFFFMVLGLVLFTVLMFRNMERFGPMGWVIVGAEIYFKFMCAYALAGMHLYYFLKKREAKRDEEALYAGEAVKPYFSMKEEAKGDVEAQYAGEAVVTFFARTRLERLS